MCPACFLEMPALIPLSGECPGGLVQHTMSQAPPRGPHTSHWGWTVDASRLTLWNEPALGTSASSYPSWALACSLLSPELCLAFSVQVKCHFLLDTLRELSQKDFHPGGRSCGLSLAATPGPGSHPGSSCGACFALTVRLAASGNRQIFNSCSRGKAMQSNDKVKIHRYYIHVCDISSL